MPWRRAGREYRPADFIIADVQDDDKGGGVTAALDVFARFRDVAAAIGFNYFLEVFNPNIDIGLDWAETAAFVNDCICGNAPG